MSSDANWSLQHKQKFNSKAKDKELQMVVMDGVMDGTSLAMGTEIKLDVSDGVELNTASVLRLVV